MELNLVILTAIFAGQLIARKTRQAKLGEFFGLMIFIAAIISIFGNAGYQSWQQYQLWKSDDLGKLFLPPYQDFNYFVFYARTRFFNPYLLSLFFGIGFLWAAKKLNKKYQERFFEPIEPYLLGTAIFLSGHPLWLFYLIILLIISLILSLVSGRWSMVNGHRLSLYYFWLPVAIFTIIISRWLAVLPWWQTLKF